MRDIFAPSACINFQLDKRKSVEDQMTGEYDKQNILLCA